MGRQREQARECQVTDGLNVVQVDVDRVAHAVGNVLQLAHILELRRGGHLGGTAVAAVAHGIFVVVIAAARERQALELVGGFCRRRLEGLEEVDQGACTRSAGSFAPGAHTPCCSS